MNRAIRWKPEVTTAKVGAKWIKQYMRAVNHECRMESGDAAMLLSICCKGSSHPASSDGLPPVMSQSLSMPDQRKIQ